MPISKINRTRLMPGTLPDDYQQVLYYKMRTMQTIVLQILSFPLFAIFGLFFIHVAVRLGNLPSSLQFGLGEVTLIAIGILLTLVLHELTHGWVMQIFGAKPRYGFLWKQAMLYTTTPNYAYRRNDYLLIILAPLFLLSVLFILGIWIMRGTFWVPIFMICGTINASGAIGDIWISIIVLKYAATAYVMDERDGMRVFLPNQIQ